MVGSLLNLDCCVQLIYVFQHIWSVAWRYGGGLSVLPFYHRRGAMVPSKRQERRGYLQVRGNVGLSIFYILLI